MFLNSTGYTVPSSTLLWIVLCDVTNRLWFESAKMRVFLSLSMYVCVLNLKYAYRKIFCWLDTMMIFCIKYTTNTLVDMQSNRCENKYARRFTKQNQKKERKNDWPILASYFSTIHLFSSIHLNCRPNESAKKKTHTPKPNTTRNIYGHTQHDLYLNKIHDRLTTTTKTENCMYTQAP